MLLALQNGYSAKLQVMSIVLPLSSLDIGMLVWCLPSTNPCCPFDCTTSALKDAFRIPHAYTTDYTRDFDAPHRLQL